MDGQAAVTFDQEGESGGALGAVHGQKRRISEVARHVDISAAAPLGLGVSQPLKPRSPKARSRALDLAGTEIDKLIDPSAPAEERQQRKRRLLKGRRMSSGKCVTRFARNRRADAEVTMGDTNMRPHKFKVGELVAFNPAVSRFAPGGVYEVIKHLPGDGEYEYRIKSANELHERVARESELTKAQACTLSSNRVRHG